MDKKIGDMMFPELEEKLTGFFWNLYNQIKEIEVQEIAENKEHSINKVAKITGRSHYYLSKMIEAGLITLLPTGKISDRCAQELKKRYSNDGSGDAKFLRDIKKLDSVNIRNLLKEK
jgi:hypothetical protein